MDDILARKKLTIFLVPGAFSTKLRLELSKTQVPYGLVATVL